MRRQALFSSLCLSSQLVNECRETLDQAIKIRTFYRDNIKLWTDNDTTRTDHVEAKMDLFERDLKEVLKVSPRRWWVGGNGG